MCKQFQKPSTDRSISQFYTSVTGNGLVLEGLKAAIDLHHDDWKFKVLTVEEIVSGMKAFALELGVYIDLLLENRLRTWDVALEAGGGNS